ncbi:MAG: neutral/alkaline non-lysosomal ceramidase N-terminal domain-containing protein [Thermoguttaceae bacterium]|nr:neutral/alkaline non-lysosomal ceramidase N-terminal domain-containing protein [Thermoguttaceae bacterium]MDW8037533.1 neutral/alkaline non-lysosomal ceramidase N-terminal domain-containing protein [Thermoguttaceae bacterium]
MNEKTFFQWRGWEWIFLVLVAYTLANLPAWAGEPAVFGEKCWKVGLAKVKITPEKPIWLAGYAARTKPAEGTLDELWVKVCVLEAADGRRAVLVTSDLLGFPREMAERIAVAAKQQFQIHRADLMLTCSHTHSGPVLKNALWEIYPLNDQQKELITEYTAVLEKKIIDCIGQALRSMEPARLEAGEGQCYFAVNRRNNKEGEVEKLRAAGLPLQGPTDPTVFVLAVRKFHSCAFKPAESGGRNSLDAGSVFWDRSGNGKASTSPRAVSYQLADSEKYPLSGAGPKASNQPAASDSLRAVIFGYACHTTTLNDYLWSGDYAGFAQAALEEKYLGVQAMFYIGCGADQNPIPRRKAELAKQYGRQLANAVAEVLSKPMRQIEPSLATVWLEIPLAWEQPTEAHLKTLANRQDYQGRWARRLLAERTEGKSWPTAYPAYPVQVWRLGQQLWIALGGEVVVDYQIRLRQIYGPTTWVVGYANDVMAYIPSHRVWQEGGYEAGAFSVYGHPAVRWAESIETDILQAVDQAVQTVGGKAQTAFQKR